MGKAATSTDQAFTPRTRCGYCRTVFEISPELLASSDTRVRCGDCRSIFDALENLCVEGSDETPAAPGADRSPHGAIDDGTGAVLARLADDADDYVGDADALNVTYSDFDLYSADAKLPEVTYFDGPADASPISQDPVKQDVIEQGTSRRVGDAAAATRAAKPIGKGTRDVDGSGDEGVMSEGATSRGGREDEGGVNEAAGPITDRSPHGVLSRAADVGTPIFESPSTPPAGRGGVWLLRALMALLFASLLLGLYLYRERDRLHNDPIGRPLLTFACRVGGCVVPSRVDLSALTLLGKEVFTHPSVDQALVINVAFRNAAPFAQRYPVLVVRLRDRVGRTVAERAFAPLDYLEGWAHGDTLAAGRRLDITLEVSDPGEGAESYEFEFRAADG